MRHRPPHRFAALLSAATPLFIRAGVRRVQMEEVARALGVAKGTVYGYVQSKEALFDACLRLADTEPPEPEQLPLPTPAAEETLAFVRDTARRQTAFPGLDAPSAGLGSAETAAILSDLYDRLSDNGTRLRLVAGSAVDWPELGTVWFEQARNPLVRRLAAWVHARTAAGLFRPGLHPYATARHITETLTWFAVHRRWDPFPDDISEAVAKNTAVSALLNVLLPDSSQDSPCMTSSSATPPS